MRSRDNNREAPTEASREVSRPEGWRETWWTQQLGTCGSKGEADVKGGWEMEPGSQKEGWYY